jgi:hypothetical protein
MANSGLLVPMSCAKEICRVRHCSVFGPQGGGRGENCMGRAPRAVPLELWMVGEAGREVSGEVLLETGLLRKVTLDLRRFARIC